MVVKGITINDPMRTYTERFFSALENQLNELSLNGEPIADQYRMSILICKKAMAKLKNYISTYSFKNNEDEIYFFKVVKPQFYSKYIYFVSVYKFIMQMPPGGEDILKDYVSSELADIKRFFDHNQTFYQYYRSGASQMDEIYFTRGGFAVQVDLEDFEEDEKYSTSHDFKLSKIIANEKYQDYLNQEMQKLVYHEKSAVEEIPEIPLIWTAGKTDLVELIYALVAQGAFNNGTADIKTVVARLQDVFQIDLGSYYGKYLDLTARKKERAIFLEKLKSALVKRIDDKFEAEGAQQNFNF
ncbi:RteC domain-containing protein [Mucilaginibacter ginkgonis]|uniref:RteC domain-containing protein n=1 Tax=Mucilaginibacter ginkgonis TaxID=2682091 RepID=A0A6I4IMS5_9SPHI|nr:RteC domain-containing protein [Mucilaginibacter ginkgonis]QQL50164.1 RteC domain-containing protein [Mucilaginibacter ginkgonis]